MIFSTVQFSLMAVMVKFISDEMSSIQIVFWRSILVTIAVLIILKLRSVNGLKNTLFLIVKEPILLIRGIAGSIALLLYFEAISQIKLSEAVMLVYTFPIFTSIFSIMFLKERFSFSLLLYLILAVSGIALITKPSLNTINTGMLYGILAAIFAGGAIVAVKKARERHPSLIITLSFSALSSLAPLPSLIGEYTPLSNKVILFILGITITALLAQITMTYAYKFIKASTGSVISMLTVVMAVIFDFIIFDKLSDMYSLIGGLLIIFSGIRLALGKPNINNKKVYP